MMIDYLDSFIDTKEKRVLFVKTLCWLGWLIVCGLALYTACRLIRVTDYAALFSLLNDDSMQLFFLSRMVLHVMSLADGALLDYLIEGCAQLSCGEWALLFISLFLWYYSKRPYRYAFVVLLQLICFFACGILFLQALQADSLQRVADSVRLIGLAMLAVYGILSAFAVFTLWRVLRQYRQALQIHVVEWLE